MTTTEHGRTALTARPGTATGPRRTSALLWLGSGAVLFFLVPWLGADLIGLQPDLYYLTYFTVAVAFFAGFVFLNRAALRGLWGQHLWQSLLFGGIAGAALSALLLQQAGTPHPEGWRYGFEIIWRGLVYGSVDAMTLFVFPAAVAYLLMRGNRRGAGRKVGFAALALALSMLVTATYHLGYAEYRGEDMRYPQLGAVVANVPTALTGNPVGALVTHSIMHVTAVVHQRDGGEVRMLPPRVTEDYPDHGSSELAAGLATGWLLAAAGAATLVVRRERKRAS